MRSGFVIILIPNPRRVDELSFSWASAGQHKLQVGKHLGQVAVVWVEPACQFGKVEVGAHVCIARVAVGVFALVFFGSAAYNSTAQSGEISSRYSVTRVRSSRSFSCFAADVIRARVCSPPQWQAAATGATCLITKAHNRSPPDPVQREPAPPQPINPPATQTGSFLHLSQSGCPVLSSAAPLRAAVADGFRSQSQCVA